MPIPSSRHEQRADPCRRNEQRRQPATCPPSHSTLLASRVIIKPMCVRITCLVLFALALMALASQAQDTPHRLILKDGSYQLVTKYEVKGDRVRYYSSEREDWEELPNSLVDWPATEKYEKDRATAAAAPEAVQLDKELEHERELEEEQQPQVAPGLRLP